MRTALSIHAESLHRPQVWARVQAIASAMSRAGSAATFFTYPFRAEAEGHDVSQRVRMLADWGHEIGQHTHFYAAAPFKHEKQDDLSAANVERCLARDFAVLSRAGTQPHGFCSGGWRFNTAVRDGLVRMGFDYDCSIRGRFAEEDPLLLRIPTTHSLCEWLTKGWRAGGRRIVYLHDYDLLDERKYFVLRAFLHIYAGRLRTVGSIVREAVNHDAIRAAQV